MTKRPFLVILIVILAAQIISAFILLAKVCHFEEQFEFEAQCKKQLAAHVKCPFPFHILPSQLLSTVHRVKV